MVEAVLRAMRAGSNTNVVVAPAATVSRTAPDPVQVATPRRPTGLDGLVSLTPLSPVAPDLEPAQRPPPPQGSAWLFDSVPAALNVPSVDQCLSLLLNAWSHDPGPHPNTSFASNVFDPASQPARHSSMQERAFAWCTLLSLYPDPIYHHQLLGMTKHGCLLGYDRLLHNANHRSNNLPISSAGHSHLCREIDARLAEGRLSVILVGTNLVELPIRVVPKPRSTKLHTIHHLSHPHQPTATAIPSVNASISLGFIRIRYKGLQDLLAFVSQNPGCLLWKAVEELGDQVEEPRGAAAPKGQHVLVIADSVIAEAEEVCVALGCHNVPESVLQIALVTACLPADWPVNHYLDDTFGAVPVLHAMHALLPVHIFALAANALGEDVYSILSPLPLMAAHIWTDACPKGYGSYLGLDTSPTAVFAKTIPPAVPLCAQCTILPPGTRGGPAGPPPGVVTSLGVSARAANLLWHSLAASTRRHAGGVPSSFQSFCLQHFGSSTSCFPVMSLQLLEWLAHLSSLGCPFHSAKHGLGARGYKCLHGVGHSGAKLPVTLPLLRQVLLAMGKMANLFPRDRLVLQAAFACFLHSGKLVWDRGTNRTTILSLLHQVGI
ncbi:hypothetical protein NDA13_004197 [Ustilago tritici]|nr:hypothetical protein NDA13_004197 [Ustilago tritici]